MDRSGNGCDEGTFGTEREQRHFLLTTARKSGASALQDSKVQIGALLYRRKIINKILRIIYFLLKNLWHE